MMKRWGICLLAALLLALPTGCHKQPSGESTPSAASKAPTGSGAPSITLAPTPTASSVDDAFTKENLPRLDGSTANIPMAVLMVQRLLGISAEEADAMLNFTTTPYAYEALVQKNTDLLLVYEADEETKQIIKSSGVELEYHPIGRDALVFITNEGNPVTSLTTAQIQDIYQGKIVNWKTLGGEDKKIEAYQRPVKSGSQALMVKLVMQNLPLMEAPSERYPGEMGGLIDALASYNNEKNALGYSVYYYANNMYSVPGLRLMAVDGVVPSEETIANGSYPFLNEFYAVIRKNEPEGGSVRRLLDWVLSEEGRRAIRDAGYVGLPS